MMAQQRRKQTSGYTNGYPGQNNASYYANSNINGSSRSSFGPASAGYSASYSATARTNPNAYSTVYSNSAYTSQNIPSGIHALPNQRSGNVQYPGSVQSGTRKRRAASQTANSQIYQQAAYQQTGYPYASGYGMSPNPQPAYRQAGNATSAGTYQQTAQVYGQTYVQPNASSSRTTKQTTARKTTKKASSASVKNTGTAKRSGTSAKRRRKRKKLRTPIKALLWLLVLGIGLMGWKTFAKTDPTVLENGISYLTRQDQLSPDTVSANIADLKKKQVLAQLGQSGNGKLNLYSLFNDSIILGDSRSEGFVSNKFMSKKINQSVLSTDITDIPNHLDAVAAAKPEVLYLCYGTNDVYRGVGEAGDGEWGKGFAEMLEGYANQALAVSPNSTIAINGLIPCSKIHTPYGFEGYVEVVNSYNNYLKDLCKKRGWVFIDNDKLWNEWGESCFVADGIHFVEDFFRPWAINMITSVYPELKDAEFV